MVFMSFLAVKLFALPSYLYVVAKNMSWLVVFVLMIIDAIYAYLIIELMKKNQDKNIYEFMKNTLGIVLTKIILIVMLVKYVIVIGIIVKGLELFIVENLYEEFNWLLYGLPLIIVVSFIIYKGIRNIGRVFEFFWLIIVVGCIFIAMRAMSGVNPLSFLPMFKDGVMPIFKCGYQHLSWFGSSVFLFMFFGKVDFSKEKKSRLFWTMVGAILLVQLLLYVFYGLFEQISPIHQFALSDIAQFSKTTSSTSGLSWLIVSIWIIGQMTLLAMFGYCFVHAFMFIFDTNSLVLGIVVLNLYILSWGIMGKYTVDVEKWFLTDFASIMTIVSEYVLTLILWLGHLVKNSKQKKVEVET